MVMMLNMVMRGIHTLHLCSFPGTCPFCVPIRTLTLALNSKADIKLPAHLAKPEEVGR